MLEIFNYEIVSDDPDFRGLSLDRFVDTICSKLPQELKFPVNVIFLSNPEIRDLNEAHRDVPEPTDVLSYGSRDTITAAEPAEIYIAPTYTLDKLKSNSACSVDMLNQQLYRVEIVRLIVHGLLHIAGYTHEDSFDGHYGIQEYTGDVKMYQVQEDIVKKIIQEL